MNRVLMNFTVSLIIGLIFPRKLPLIICTFLILSCIYLICFIKLKRHFVATIIFGLVAGMILSMLAPNYSSGEIHRYENKPVQCTMVVRGVPVITDRYVKFEACVENIDGNVTNEKVLVYVYDATNINLNHRLTFDNIKFKLPSDQRNPGGFDYRKYLTGKDIYFTGTTSVKNLISSVPAERTLLSVSAYINNKISNRISELFTPESGGIFSAVLIGDKNDIDDNTLGSFRDSGLSHIMSVSGLHLAIIVMLLGIFTKYINRWLRFAISFIFIMVFAFITGLPVSVIRASVMLLLFQFADAMYLEGDSLTNLSVAALVVLIPNPNAVYDIGFVMSYSATLGILCLSQKFRHFLPDSMPATIAESVSVTLSAQIGTLPFSAAYFGQLSVLAVVSNLLIVVLMPAIYIFGVPALVTGWMPLVKLAEFFLMLLLKWTVLCAKLPGQMQYVTMNGVVLTGLFVFSLTVMLVSAFKNKKLAVWLMTAALLISVSGSLWEIRPVKGTEITFLNVGQADSTLIRTGNSAFLIDTATEYMGENEITGYLLRNGLSELDGIFISHFDNDHCGGLLKILDKIEVSVVYVPDTADVGVEQYKLLLYAQANDIPVYSLKIGDKIKIENTEISVLYPPSGTLNDGENNASMVLRVDNKDMNAIFTGDLQNDSVLENCDTDILKVSHHGSKNGTTEEFLAKNTPEIAVISLAENNSYGFPHTELMERLNRYTDKIYRTDLHKTVTIQCNNKKYDIKTFGQVN